MIYLLLSLGLFLLFWGGDKLVEGGVAVARRLGLSPLLIGLTLVGFGTSTPELLTSLLAVHQNSEGIAVGNVVGSNIANILLVLGAAAILRPVRIHIKSFKRDAAFLIISTVVLIIAAVFGRINIPLGLIMVLTLVGYVVYSYYSEKGQKNAAEELTEIAIPKTTKALVMALLKSIVGIILTLLGAKLLVDNSIKLATAWGVSEGVIGLTIVAVGTSLPEFATSVMASIRGHNDVAFGNVVGSNIFNALFILGITTVFMPVTIPSTMNSDIIIMTLVTALLIGIGFYSKKYSKRTGLLFLLLYAVYVVYLGYME